MKIAALFSGQGSHALGMGQAMAAAFPVAQAVMDEAEAAVPGLLTLMREGPLEDLTLTANQQPALVATGVADSSSATADRARHRHPSANRFR